MFVEDVVSVRRSSGNCHLGGSIRDPQFRLSGGIRFEARSPDRLGGGIIIIARSSAGGRKAGGKPTVLRFDATRQSRARLTDLSRHLSLGRMLGARAQSRMSFPNGTCETDSFFFASTS